MPHKLPLGPERSCWLGRRREEAQRGEWGMWVCGGRAAPGATFASQDCISFHLRAEPAQWLLHFSSFFFLTYFDQSLLSWHPQRDILTSENSFSIFRLWPTKAGFSFLPSDREVCHLKWLVLKVCTWGLDNQVNDGKLRCVNVIVLKHVQMCRCYQANLCLAADRNSELWGSEFASKLGQARRRLRTTLFTGAENIFVAFSCA